MIDQPSQERERIELPELLAEIDDLIDFHNGTSDNLPTVKSEGDEVRALRESKRHITRLQADLQALKDEKARREAFIERRGYRRCDIPACNCNGWHGGHAEERLREISESLGDAGATGTVHGAVLQVIARAEAAEAALLAHRQQVAEVLAHLRFRMRGHTDGDIAINMEILRHWESTLASLLLIPSGEAPRTTEQER